MEQAILGGTFVLGLCALVVALWQGVMSRQQLQLAIQTNGKTEDALAEIKRVTEANRQTAEDLKRDFDQRIGRLVDQYLETTARRADAEHQDDRAAAAATEGFMNFLGDALGEPLKQAMREGTGDESARDGSTND